jgi:peptide/nickel transport system substrate-binding protein
MIRIAKMVVVLGWLLAVTTIAASAQAAALKDLNVAFSAELRSLDPTIDNNSFSIATQSAVLESLARTTKDLSIVPFLAESWTSIAPTKWRIKLRPGVKFHNGEPLNADAVAYSLQVYHNTMGMSRGYLDFISSAEKVDDLTVDLITRDPTSILPSSLAFLYVFPPAYYAKVGPDGFGKSPIGTGPWRFKQWTPGVGLDLDPNPDYWGKRPNIGAIHIRWAADASTRVAMLQNDEIQFTNDIPPAMLDRVKSSGDTRIEAISTTRKIYLMMDINKGITSDVRVRRGLNYAIDVDTIIKSLFQGHAYGRDKGLILEGLEGYQGDAVKPFSYDPQRAKQLFAEAGYPDGFTIDLSYPIGRYLLDKEAAAAIAGQLEKVGVKVNLKGSEPGAYFARTISLNRTPGLLYFSCSPLFVTPIYCSLLSFNPGGLQAYGETPESGDYIRRIIAELDPAKRVELIHQYENYIDNDVVPFVWLWRQEAMYGVSDNLVWKPQPDEKIYFADMSWR